MFKPRKPLEIFFPWQLSQQSIRHAFVKAPLQRTFLKQSTADLLYKNEFYWLINNAQKSRPWEEGLVIGIKMSLIDWETILRIPWGEGFVICIVITKKTMLRILGYSGEGWIHRIAKNQKVVKQYPLQTVAFWVNRCHFPFFVKQNKTAVTWTTLVLICKYKHLMSF